VTPDRTEVDLDLVTASLRADATDSSAFVESLAAKLEGAVPGHVRVQRRRSGVLGPKTVRSVSVDLGDRRLELLADGGTVQTRCARLSGGIVLKSEAVDTDVWLTALSEALAGEARRSETTRRALERLLTE
jgi:hypothetical protein